MRTLFILIIVFVSGCSTLPTTPEPPSNYLTTCGNLESAKGVKYCVLFRQGQEIKQTMIYLPGLGDDANVLQKSLWDQTSLKELVNKLQNTIIVFISYENGPKILNYSKSWLLTIYPKRWRNPEEATVEVFKTKVLPELAQKFPLTKPWKLVGHSQGGQNVATLCTQLPALFGSCALLNPMLISCNPFNLFDFNCLSAPIFRAHYNKKEWEEYGQNRMLERAVSTPPMVVTACSKDKFKLYDGAKDYAAKAQIRGLPVVFVEGAETCSHQAFAVDSVVRFLEAK